MPVGGAKIRPLTSISDSDTDWPCPPFLSIDDVDRIRDEPGLDVVVADVRWYLDGRDAREIHRLGHVPGAVFVDVDHDLSTPGAPTDGRHPLPSPEEFARAMSRLGITDDTWVVAHDDTGGMTAGRLVVMLRMIGRRASLLDGGLAAWVERHGDRLETGIVDREPSTFTPVEWPTERLATIDDLEHFVATRPHGATVVLDARPPERFRGEVSVAADPRLGHVPGAFNAPWNALVIDGHLLARDELMTHYLSFGVDLADDVIASCGSGVSACLNVLAMEHAGFTPPRLFVASWSGWASDPDRPTETGESRPDRARLFSDRRRADHGSASIGSAALHDLRGARRRRRLERLEWFETLYRVYLAAFVFGGSFVFVAGFVTDDTLSPDATTRVLTEGPGWAGLVAAVAIALGMRSGSLGGPLAVEEADLRYVLSAPIDRRRALLVPATQRVRTFLFSGSLLGAAVGYLASRRLPGDAIEWILAIGLFGAVVGAATVGAALVAHSSRAPRWAITLVAVGLVIWQFVSALPDHTDTVGPTDAFGGLARWAHDTEAIDSVAIVVSVVLVLTGFLLLRRLSLEALGRRSSLVSQLRFAVTLQDLRTVMLLRRQLSHERSRRRPWLTRRPDRGPNPHWQRAWQGLLRFPGARVMRITALAVAAGAASAGALNGTTPLVIVSGFITFVIGLELTEPLAQEIDHRELTDRAPVTRTTVHVRLLTVSFVAAIPFALVAGVTFGVIGDDAWSIAAIVVGPMMAAGVAGAAVDVVSGAPDPIVSLTRDSTMPPEVAGTANIVKAIFPIAIATVGQVAVVVAASSRRSGQGAEAAAVRGGIFAVLVIGAVVSWIQRRDSIHAWFERARDENLRRRTGDAVS